MGPPDDSTSVDTGQDPPDDAPELDPDSVSEPLAGRLTDLQYRYTVLDVLGADLTANEIAALPADIPTGRDYSTTVEPQFFNSNYVLAYAEIARSVTARLDPGELLATHGQCTTADAGCERAFVEGLGLRLFRRPLTDVEVERYLALAAAVGAIDETDNDDAVRGIVQAMLQAPQFLYRVEDETDGEPGELRTVDGWELASRLSYFLWQSAPDDALLAFAAGPDGDGQYDPDALPDQIDRMLASAKFARSRELFWGDYTLAARSGFATSDTQLADELRSSLLATLDRICGVGAPAQPLTALFDGQQIMMTPAVAEIAGAQPKGDGLQVYETSEATQRLGVVTHPGMLASIGTTSFVGRGLFLSERLLCQHPVVPPASIGEQIEDTAQATEDMTPRQASEFRMQIEPVCQGCHLAFEPIAYAFERYDLGGRYSTTDEQGRELFSDGELPAAADRDAIAFDDAPQLLTELAGSVSVKACIVENMTQFGTGQPANLAGTYHDTATDTFVESDMTFESLVRAVAASEQRTLLRVVQP